MITQIFYFLPCLVSLMCVVSLLVKQRTSRQNVFLILQLCDVVYYIMYALYTLPHTDYAAMVRLDAVATPLSLCIAALVATYLHLHHVQGKFKPSYFLLLVPGLIVAAVFCLLYYMVGFDDAEQIAKFYDLGLPLPSAYDTPVHQTYIFVVGALFRWCSILFILAIVVECAVVLRKGRYRFGDTVRFLMGREEMTPSSIIAILFLLQFLLIFPLAAMGRSFSIHYAALSIVLTVILAFVKLLIYHVEVCSDACHSCTIYSLTHVKSRVMSEAMADVPVDEVVAQENQASAEGGTSSSADAVAASSNRIDVLAERFRQMMEEKKLYQDENLTLASLSEKLGVGRTTLSVMINQKYGMPFRDLLNHYRIEAVKAYLLQNPTATQETLAYECGFKYASSLNRKFKEAEGDTPLMWIAKHAPSDETEDR
ncbi:MAG: AraC family transcriptional regulator [Bacteroidales bacterium]|nr:AraC family transcriptional regulator [Candidatus Equimonas faecalis]